MTNTRKSTIRELREQRGWSQRRLSVLLDVAISTVQDWEGERKEPKLRQMQKIMDVFAVGWDAIQWPQKRPKQLEPAA
jgi:transcriptional regulator with XRE-family HTH domain